MTKPNPPAYLDLALLPESEDRSPVTANFVNVEGEGDMFALDFFYVHPAKVNRIFEGGPLPEGATRDGDTVVARQEPVVRLTIPLTTAAELVTELVERIGAGVPNLRAILEDFGTKLHVLSHTAEHLHGDGDDDEDSHDHDHDEDHDDEDHDDENEGVAT